LETLKQVLNDVLECVCPSFSPPPPVFPMQKADLPRYLRFSKLSNQSHSNAAPIAPALSPTDLNVLAVDLIKSCWSQVRQYVALHDDGAEGGGGEEEDHKLEVFFESSVAPGTIGLVDVGGLKRVLINLFGNALKVRRLSLSLLYPNTELLSTQFTSKGNITLRVGEVCFPFSPFLLLSLS
jgi:signal transduction histidine kinase